MTREHYWYRHNRQETKLNVTSFDDAVVQAEAMLCSDLMQEHDVRSSSGIGYGQIFDINGRLVYEVTAEWNCSNPKN